MSDNSIKVSTQVLRDTAKKIRTINTSLDEKLSDINKKMQSLESSWESDAARDIRDAMNAMLPRFEQYWNVINSYATFLDTAAGQYEQTETTIQSAAGLFK